MKVVSMTPQRMVADSAMPICSGLPELGTVNRPINLCCLQIFKVEVRAVFTTRIIRTNGIGQDIALPVRQYLTIQKIQVGECGQNDSEQPRFYFRPARF